MKNETASLFDFHKTCFRLATSHNNTVLINEIFNTSDSKRRNERIGYTIWLNPNPPVGLVYLHSVYEHT